VRKRDGFAAQRADLMLQAAQHVLPLRFEIAHLRFDTLQGIGDRTGVLGRRRRRRAVPQPQSAEHCAERQCQNNCD
jgi:hypothetical protein